MSELRKCSALVGDVCNNGFWTTPACNPVGDGVRSPPMCMNEDWCARVFHKTDGIPPKLFALINEVEP